MKVVDKTKHKQLKKEASKGNNKKEDENKQDFCCIPMVECIKIGEPLPQSPAEGVKFECSNSDCSFAKQFAHPECFEKLEKDLLILLRSHGDARGWPEEKLMLAFKKVWRRKGSTFLQSSIKCKCGKGVMMRDEDAWEKREAAIVPPEKKPEKKEKKKAKASNLPELQHKGAPHKLDHHWLSSHSPPPGASHLDDKYGPITKPPKRTRKETDTSMTSNDTNVVKRRVPIGFAPIEEPKPGQKQKSEEPQPKPVNPVEAKPAEPVKAWQKLDQHIESDKSNSHQVESEAMKLQERLKVEELRKGNPWEHVDELKGTFRISSTISNSKFVSIAVQTEETCFPIRESSYKPYQSRNAMAIQTAEIPYPESVLNGFDSGINSTACSPKAFADSYQRKTSFGDSAPSHPRGFPAERLKKLSITENPEMMKSSFNAMPPASTNFSADPIINFLFKENYCAIEVFQNGKREYIKNAYDNDWTPMYLSMLEKSPEIGETAHGHSQYFSEYVIYDILKIVGRSLNEIEIDPEWGFKLVNQNGIVYFQIKSSKDGDRLMSQEIVFASFFKTMKAQAEAYLKTAIKEVNLSTDFRLTDSQKLVFGNAAEKVHLKIGCFRFSL